MLQGRLNVISHGPSHAGGSVSDLDHSRSHTPDGNPYQPRHHAALYDRSQGLLFNEQLAERANSPSPAGSQRNSTASIDSRGNSIYEKVYNFRSSLKFPVSFFTCNMSACS